MWGSETSGRASPGLRGSTRACGAAPRVAMLRGSLKNIYIMVLDSIQSKGYK